MPTTDQSNWPPNAPRPPRTYGPPSPPPPRCSCAVNQPNCPVHSVVQAEDKPPPQAGTLAGRVVGVEVDPNHPYHVRVKCKVMIKFGGPRFGGWNALWVSNSFHRDDQPKVGDVVQLEWRVDGS